MLLNILKVWFIFALGMALYAPIGEEGTIYSFGYWLGYPLSFITQFFV